MTAISALEIGAFGLKSPWPSPVKTPRFVNAKISFLKVVVLSETSLYGFATGPSSFISSVL
ncbi:Uncharacterised protein [Streptococcus pneumoniae]|nr:Uncharacterised protein [Streptococcus pneumoniae]